MRPLSAILCKNAMSTMQSFEIVLTAEYKPLSRYAETLLKVIFCPCDVLMLPFICFFEFFLLTPNMSDETSNLGRQAMLFLCWFDCLTVHGNSGINFILFSFLLYMHNWFWLPDKSPSTMHESSGKWTI